ncbi:glutamate--cysteine ligase catalytic subunit-like [Hylaeus volcanicus]|uniref:glutamate--cysteine ligase catalytic subunit-like n=1 Tax=Hylaeus volcanicus TaxID=313075 RepID=UPI0023B7753E|nr:glutamate--cysteine ligase catalytic subunit-like [Hylaeus volcanicus]
MGYLDSGSTLLWNDAKQFIPKIKKEGLKQFLSVWKNHQQRHDTSLSWGDELELSLVCVDDSHSCLVVNGEQLIRVLQDKQKQMNTRKDTAQTLCEWHPEFSNHMVEVIPQKPYKSIVDSIFNIFQSMHERRLIIQNVLQPNQFVVSFTAYPRFGLPGFLEKKYTPSSGFLPLLKTENSNSQSLFIPDVLPNPHARFSTLVYNIKCRRQVKPFIIVPLYMDKFTNGGYCSNHTSDALYQKEKDWSQAQKKEDLDRFTVAELSKKTINPVKGHVYMDAFAFGMSQCCVQTTHMCSDEKEARYLHDQLLVLAPFFLALSASTCVERGYLVNTDTRWETLEQAVDCRTQKEKHYIKKSRYSSSSLYLSNEEPHQSNYNHWNDTHPYINQEAKNYLIENGVDMILANHIAHLWIRDPLVIYENKVDLDSTEHTDHFENIQSTNWNSVRFKPPPKNKYTTDSIGWRVECRSPESQLSDIENSSLVAFISILTQVITKKRLNFYIPMSMNDENMFRAQQRDAVTQQTFYFRTNIFTTNFKELSDPDSIQLLSLHEILCGSATSTVSFPGLVALCYEYIQETQSFHSSQALDFFQKTMHLYIQRVQGKLLTGAQFLRQFIISHPCYQQDSFVNDIICRDITIVSIYLGFHICTALPLLGDIQHVLPLMSLPHHNVKTLQLPRFSSQLLQRFQNASWYATSLVFDSNFSYLITNDG